MLLEKSKLNAFKVLISKALINSCISHDDFVSVNVLREYYDTKEEIKNSETSVEYTVQKWLYKQRDEWKNGVETIVDSDEVLWLNEKHIEEGLDHKYLWVTTVNYLSDYRKGRYNLAVEPKKTTQQNFFTQKNGKQSNHGL